MNINRPHYYVNANHKHDKSPETLPVVHASLSSHFVRHHQHHLHFNRREIIWLISSYDMNLMHCVPCGTNTRLIMPGRPGRPFWPSSPLSPSSPWNPTSPSSPVPKKMFMVNIGSFVKRERESEILKCASMNRIEWPSLSKTYLWDRIFRDIPVRLVRLANRLFHSHHVLR